MNMRSEIASWTARASKHAGVGYPLVTMLLCLEDTPTFLQFVDTLVDNLHRQLKVRCACLSGEQKCCLFSWTTSGCKCVRVLSIADVS